MIRAYLDEATISSTLTALSTNYWRVRVIEEVGSTQDELKHELVRSGDCVTAEFQSAGRGRLDRKFDSPPRVGLLFSFYIEPNKESQWGWIPLIAGMAVASVLNEELVFNHFTTKWPNDVLAPSGKIAGVLCERYAQGIIVGIGVNVSTTVDELPVATASSIFIDSGVELNRNELLPKILRAFERLFIRWDNGADLTPTYRALSQTIGREVEVILPSATKIRGLAIGVDGEGQLLMEGGDRISVGDIEHLR